MMAHGDETVATEPSLSDLVFCLGVDLIAQTPEDPMVDSGRALVANLRLSPIPEIMQKFLEELSDDTQIIEIFGQQVEENLAYYREQCTEGW